MFSDLLEPLGSLNILIIEDDPIALDLLRLPLERRCQKVFATNNPKDALRIFKNNYIDIFMSDVNLENSQSGITLAQEIRKMSVNLPIIFMTAYDDRQKVAKMLEIGTYSLIKKPVDLEELFVSLLNISKTLHKQEIVELGEGLLYRRKDKVVLKGYASFELTEREYQILELLIQADGFPVPYDNFKEKVWNGQNMTMDSLRMHINSLRRKTSHHLIKNHSRLGYKLIMNPKQQES